LAAQARKIRNSLMEQNRKSMNEIDSLFQALEKMTGAAK
jgi:hypothetical protein